MHCISRSLFSIIHCSSQDSGHPATSLQSPSPWCTGWLSAKFCMYPQELVLGLDEPMKVRKIQLVSHPHCIASKVEFYIGDCPDNEPRHVNNVRWSRLGHVTLLNNQSGDERRELKSIHLEANGSYVKLCLHSNYANLGRNPYNQVGIVALAVQAQPLDEESGQENSKTVVAAAAAANAAKQSAYIDLSFDLSCHPSLADIVRKLDAEKQQLVAKELLGDARNVQARITAAVSHGRELAELELAKISAIATENYDLAENSKIAIQNKLKIALAAANAVSEESEDNIRLSVDMQTEIDAESPGVAMDTSRTEGPSEIDIANTNANNAVNNRRVLSKSYDDTPLPTHQNLNTDSKDDLQPAVDTSRTSQDAANTIDQEAAAADDVDQSADFASASGALPPDLLAKTRSTSRSARAEALAELTNLVSGVDFASAWQQDLPAPTPVEFYRAALTVCQRGFEDAAVTVHEAALPLGRALLVGFVDKQNLAGSELHYGCCRLTPPLLAKLGDTAARIRDSSRDFLLEMAGWPKVRQMPDAPLVHLCLRPLRRGAATLERQSVVRVQLAGALYQQLGLTAASKAGKTANGQVSLGALLTFAFSALGQRHIETRRAAEALLLEVASRSDCRDRVKRRLAKAIGEAAGVELPAFKSLAAKLK